MIESVSFHRAGLATVCAVLAAAAIGCSTPLSGNSTTAVDTSRPVPSVTGLTAKAATAKLTAAGFTVSQTQVFSTTPPGGVAAQSPAAGKREPIGAGVTITVSRGKGVVVPNVHGLTYAAAVHRLRLAGLTAGGVHDYSPTVASGLIMNQGAAAGTRVASGTHVTLYVSKGHAPVPVPNVRSDSIAGAEHALAAAGFAVKLLKAPRHGASCSPGQKIYRTYPHAHQLRPYRSLVKIVPCP